MGNCEYKVKLMDHKVNLEKGETFLVPDLLINQFICFRSISEKPKLVTLFTICLSDLRKEGMRIINVVPFCPKNLQR